MVAAVLVTALGSFAFSYVAADRAFGTYVRRFQSLRQQRVVSVLESYWETNGSWSGVQTVLDSSLRPGAGMGMAGGMGAGRMMGAEADRITLLSPAGAVVADTAGLKVGTVVKYESWEIVSL